MLNFSKHQNRTHTIHSLDKFKYCPACGSAQFKASSPKSKRCEACGFEYFLNPSAAVAAFIVNARGELLVVRRKTEPAGGTLDLPGGFCDMGESLLEALRREVKEETGLVVGRSSLIFSLPNRYRYSNFDVPTLDSFFVCSVENAHSLRAADDAAEAMWMPMNEIEPEKFGLQSIRQAVEMFIRQQIAAR